MGIVPTKSHTRIESDRKWEDYASLKRYWSPKRKFREVLYTGQQTATQTAAEVVQVGDTIAFLGADDQVYISSEADLEALDGDSVWIDYVNKLGTLYENIETKLDDQASTATEVPIGCEAGTKLDAVAAVNGDVLTMTALNSSVVNEFIGWYVVATGAAADQEGENLTVLSSTATSPVLLTCTTTPNGNWAADAVSVQKNLYNDVFRIRRMWSETESPTDNYQGVVDKDSTNIYALVADANTYGGAGSRYYALSSAHTCYLGRVQMYAPQGFQANDESLCHVLTVTFTPVSNAGQAPADITLAIEFNDYLDWQPCFELEPCTDVIFKIHKVLNSEDFIDITLDYAILEIIE